MGAAELRHEEKRLSAVEGDADIKQEHRVLEKVPLDLNSAIEAAQFGKFHWLLSAIGGLYFLATGLEFGLQGYVLPFAQCELDIGSNEVGFINAMFLGGAIASSLFWGLVADTFGRRTVLLVTLGVDGICCLIASCSGSYIMFAAVRFVNGFMCGGPGAIGPSYIGEFISDKRRSVALSAIGFCWTMAWMLLPLLAWAIIPADINIVTSFVTFTSWRAMVALAAIPNLLAALALWYYLMETPKFLYFQGREAEALKVLGEMFARNTGRSADEYPVSKIVMGSGEEKEKEDRDVEAAGPRPVHLGAICSSMGRQITQLLTPPLLGKTILGSLLYFTNFAGYYGLLFWTPELYNRFEDYYAVNPNASVTICELSNLRQNMTLHGEGADIGGPGTDDCTDNKTVNLAVFSNTFILGAASCMSNILVAILSNKFEGRIMASVTMFIAGFSAIYIYFIRSIDVNVAFTTVFAVSVNSTFVVLCYVLVNLFPTSVRGMGVCVAILSGRLGAVLSNILFGAFIDSYCEIPIFSSGICIIVGAFLCFLLPKDSQKATE